MAIKIGNKSEEGVYKLYKGIAALNVVAVNPNKAQLEKITGRSVDEEPVYLGKDDEGNDPVRVTVYAKTAPEAKVNNGIDLNVSFSFILTKATRVGQASGKTQIIDKFGRTAWATSTDLANKAIPVYASGPANIAPDYRPAARGEEALVNFLIKWLNIPAPANYKDGKWVMKDNTEDSEVSLNLNKLFAGDVSEISSLVEPAAEFAVKAAVGIRTTDDGKQYQAVFTREFAKNSVTDYSKLDAAIMEFKNAGGAPNTEFDCTHLHENVVESTVFAAPKTEVVGDMPDFTNVQNPWA